MMTTQECIAPGPDPALDALEQLHEVYCLYMTLARGWKRDLCIDSSIAQPLRQTRILALKTFQIRDSNLRLT